MEKKMHSETRLLRPNTAATLMHKMQHMQHMDWTKCSFVFDYNIE